MGLTIQDMCKGFCSTCLATLILLACRPRAPEPPSGPEKLTLVAVGDILMHGDVKQAAVAQGGFEPLWADVSPLFQSADLVFGNLETPVAPLIGQPGIPYLFNAPQDLPEALKHSGFTILSTANNHVYDQGPAGLQETLTHLEVAGLIAVGSGRTESQALAARILERNGIRIAFLAWTDLLNRSFNRAGQGPWVNRLDVDQACADVRTVRSQVDVVVVSLHWGKEDQHDPTARQREIALRLFEAGADLILGHHPHVLQPLEATGVGGRHVAVAYSLGNFISNQDRFYDPARMALVQGDERDGAAVSATFARKGPNRVELQEIGYIPLWTENNGRDVLADETVKRAIRVVRLDAPARQVRPWLQRRDRIREVLKEGLELPGRKTGEQTDF